MAFGDTFDKATPAGSDSPSEADDRMREIKAAIQERENVDHYWPLTGTEVSDTDSGEHRKVTLRVASAPTAVADKGFVYAKDVAGKAELFYRDEDGNEIQITSAGKLLGDSLKDNSVDEDAIELSNNSFLSAKDVGGGSQVSIIKVDASDNVIIRSVGSNTAKLSSEATLVGATDIVHKGYVDDTVGAKDFGVPDTKDDQNDNLERTSIYQAQQDGFVTAIITVNSSATPMLGFIGVTSNPATEVSRFKGQGSVDDGSLTFPVPKDWYFKVTAVANIAGAYRWHPVGTYDAPVIQ